MGGHPRGNFEGYLAAGSAEKWLEVHDNTHFASFYRASGITLQKRFFGHFLKGEDTGWNRQRPVELDIRRPGEHFTTRAEQEWPLARTQWTRYYLDAGESSLVAEPKQAAALAYDAMGDELTFSLPVSDKEVEITGPIAARLFVSRHGTAAASEVNEPGGIDVRPCPSRSRAA